MKIETVLRLVRVMFGAHLMLTILIYMLLPRGEHPMPTMLIGNVIFVATWIYLELKVRKSPRDSEH